MSPGELVRLLNGRPAIVIVNGWTVFLSVHDEAYLQTLKDFKRRLAEAHPDHGGSSAKFRKVIKERQKFRRAEATWYAYLGLLPPDGFTYAAHRVARVRRLKGQE